MKFLVDTNVVLRNGLKDDPVHALARDAILRWIREGGEPCISAQNVIELWVVLTRPVEVNGLGLSPARAEESIHKVLSSYILLPDPLDLVPRWLALCTRHEVRGRQAHDARLVAFMDGHEITRMLSWNATDFKRYQSVTCVVPGQNVPLVA